MPRSPNQIRYARQLMKTLTTVVERRQDWLHSLIFLIAKRDTFAKVPERSALFWIRLHGLLLAITDGEKERLRLLTDASHEPRQAIGRLPETGANSERVVEALRALRATLQEPELVAIDYLRHAHCHPNVDAYLYKFARDGETLNDTYQPKLVNRRYGKEELRSMVQLQLNQHGGEAGLAAAIAEKIEGHAHTVWECFQPLFELTE